MDREESDNDDNGASGQASLEPCPTLKANAKSPKEHKLAQRFAELVRVDATDGAFERSIRDAKRSRQVDWLSAFPKPAEALVKAKSVRVLLLVLQKWREEMPSSEWTCFTARSDHVSHELRALVCDALDSNAPLQPLLRRKLQALVDANLFQTATPSRYTSLLASRLSVATDAHLSKVGKKRRATGDP
jgi:hypothetical protein